MRFTVKISAREDSRGVSGYTLIFSINALLHSGRGINEIRGEILLEQVKLSSFSQQWGGIVGLLEGFGVLYFFRGDGGDDRDG